MEDLVVNQIEIFKRVVPIMCDWDPSYTKAGLEQMRLQAKGSRVETITSAMDLLLHQGRFSADAFTEVFLEGWKLFLGFVLVASFDGVDPDYKVTEVEIVRRLLDIAESARVPVTFFRSLIEESAQTYTRLMLEGISMN